MILPVLQGFQENIFKLWEGEKLVMCFKVCFCGLFCDTSQSPSQTVVLQSLFLHKMEITKLSNIIRRIIIHFGLCSPGN